MSPAYQGLRMVSLGSLVLLYLPILVLGLFSFNASRFSAAWQGFSLQWYAALANDESLVLAFQNSLTVAIVSTVLATVLGLGLALGLHERAAPPSTPASGGQDQDWSGLERLLLLPLVIPEVMMGVALLLFFVLIKLPLGLLTIILGHTTFNLPVVVIILLARLRKLDPRLLEAAQDLGATRWQGFRHVTFPLLRPAIFGAMLMAFTISLDDFIVTFFTAGPGSATLPVKVYSMLKSGITPVINALSTVLVFVSMAGIGLALLLQRDELKRSQ
jgi:spermidine/putrescine transport system permease protein